METSNLKLQSSRRPVLRGLGCLAAVLLAGEVSAAGSPVSFSRDIAPILADKCLTCHKEGKAKGGYRVDAFARLAQKGDSEAPALTPGKPEASTLFSRLVTPEEDDRMPANDDPLPPAQVALVKRWIQEGAKFDGGDATKPLGELLAASRKSPGAPEKYPRPLAITAAVFSGDGRTFFTSGYHEVLEWSASEGKLLRRLPGMPERVLGLALQQEGGHLAVAGGTPGKGGEVVVVSLATGQVVQRLPGTPDTALAVAFSPDSTLLATGGTDNTLRVYRVEGWKPAWKVEAHADWITALVFSPDSKHLVSTSRDRTAKVLAAEGGSPGLTFSNHGSAVTSVAFDADGTMVTTGAADGEVRRWAWNADVDGSGRAKDKLLKSRRQEVTRLAPAPGRVFAASADGKIRVYDLKQVDKEPAELEPLGARVDALAVDADGTRLLVAGQGGKLQVLNLAESRKALTVTAAPGW